MIRQNTCAHSLLTVCGRGEEGAETAAGVMRGQSGEVEGLQSGRILRSRALPLPVIQRPCPGPVERNKACTSACWMDGYKMEKMEMKERSQQARRGDNHTGQMCLPATEPQRKDKHHVIDADATGIVFHKQSDAFHIPLQSCSPAALPP